MAVVALFVTGVAGAGGGGVATVATTARRADHPRSLTLLAGGDVLVEGAVRDAAAAQATNGERFDFTPLLAPLAATLQSVDLAICHAELPIGAPGQAVGNIGRSPFGGNRLLAPNELAGDLAAVGFRRCTTASNHSDDAGVVGIGTTLEALDAAGISHAGTARTLEEAADMTAWFPAGDAIRTAHLSYTRGSNNVPLTPPWRVNYSPSVDGVAADIAAARQGGAELVIVSVHVMPEMSSTPHPDDRQFVTRLAQQTGVDLVIMHGAHVVQPIEMVDATIVFWGLGNMVSGMGVAGTGRYEDRRTLDGLLAGVRFVESPSGGFVHEVWGVVVCVDPATRTVWPGVSALSDPTTPEMVRPVLEACVARTSGVVPALR